MCKLKKLLISGLLAFSLVGCSSKEEEIFNQGNIMTLYGPVMETDSAYYYTTNDFNYELHYYDKASGKSIFLCNKPECSHDGNEFCAATAGGRYVMHSVLYEDGIYIAALEAADNRVDKKLFKVSLDGTKLETICTYGYEPSDGMIMYGFDVEKYMAIYREKAFVPYSTPQKDNSNNYGTAIIDIKSGKVEYLEECNSYSSLGQKKYIPYGDYLYYYVSDIYQSPAKLCRYHLTQKNNEEIAVLTNFRDYCIVDGMVIYTQADENGYVHIYTMDPDSKETKDLTGPLMSEDGTGLLTEWEGTLFFDGEYIVTFTYPKKENGVYQYFVFSKEGTLLTDFTPPEFIEKGYKPDFCMLNGYAYFRDYYGMVRCSMQDILNGNPEWTTLFVTAQEEQEG